MLHALSCLLLAPCCELPSLCSLIPTPCTVLCVMCPLIPSFFSMASAQDLCTLFCAPCLCFMFCVLSLASDCDLDQNMHSNCVATTKLHRNGRGLVEKFSFSSVRIQVYPSLSKVLLPHCFVFCLTTATGNKLTTEPNAKAPCSSQVSLPCTDRSPGIPHMHPIPHTCTFKEFFKKMAKL